MELSDIAALPWVAPVDRLALPGGDAIYFFLGDNGQLLYIGATVHLRDRMGTNRWLRTGVDVGIARIAWMRCEWPGSETVEADLIFKLKPPLNVRGKTVRLHPEQSLWHKSAADLRPPAP